jgi:MFS family permease
MNVIDRQSDRLPTLGKAWFSLAALLTVAMYSYLDRPVVTLLTEPMRNSLALSDFEVGLIQSFGPTIFIAVFAYPIAATADRLQPRYIIALAMALWGAAIAGIGASQTFLQIFAASALVGIAEAALVPIAYAMVPALFEERWRSIANAALVAAGRLGSGAVYVVAGAIVAFGTSLHPLPLLPLAESWRLSLFVLAALAPIFVGIALCLPRFPEASVRTGASSDKLQSTAQIIRRYAGTLVPFWLGVGFLVFALAAFTFFIPVVALRTMGVPVGDVANIMAALSVCAMLCALATTMLIHRLFRTKVGAVLSIWILIGGAIGAAVLAVCFVFVTSPTSLFAILAGVFFFIMLAQLAYPTAVQDLAPPHIRARVISLSIVVSMVMSSIGQPAAGLLSDILDPAGGRLLFATAATGLAGLILAVPFLLMTARRFEASRAGMLDATSHAVAPPPIRKSLEQQQRDQ